MPRPNRKLPVLFIALLAAAFAAGCGGDGESQDPAEVLGATFSNARPIKSGRLNLALDVKGASVAGLPAPFSFSLGGPFASNPGGKVPKFQFQLAVGSGSGRTTLGAISTGAHGWVQIAGKAYTLPDETFAGLGKGRPSTSTEASGLKLSDLGVDPRRWLRGAEVVGDEDLSGDRVTHVSSGVDVERLLDDLASVLGSADKLGVSGLSGLGSALSPTSRASLAAAIQDAHVDVWTGAKDRLLRRLRIDAKVKGSDGKDGTVRLELSLADINEPQPIGPPANPRPLAELTSALTALAATTGASGATGAAGSASRSGSAQTYDACITAAGSDLAAAQACASLVGR